jgi:predicted Zn finger-like uncharacterized protein
LIIVCNSCSAQYSVSDAKVRGKLVRITCKHCSTAIVVDGRQMSEVEVPSQKPLSAYVLPRRDESVVAHMPQSIAPARAKAAAVSSPAHAAVSAPAHVPVSSPVSTPMQSAFSAELREEDRTMVARSRFGDDMSVHEERTVIGQIPREALEFERMFAQRTQPPPPDEKNEVPTAPPPAVPAMGSPGVPSFSSAPPPGAPGDSATTAPPPRNEAEEADEDETGEVRQEGPSLSEPPTVGEKPTSDSRGLVSLAEATHPSVVRSTSARRLRVTVVTLLVLAVLVALFVIQKPH